MNLVLLFIIVSLAVGAAVFAFCAVGIGQAALWALGCFVLLHLAFIVVTFIAGLFMDTEKPIEKQNPYLRWATAAGCGIICFYSGVSPRIIGVEKLPREGRFLLVCNHRSMFDPIIVLYRLYRYNIAFISKPSNMRMPLVGRAMFGAGCMSIDRENDRNALKTILRAADYLKKGSFSVGIYPEGTRSKDGTLLPFHAGSFKIAQRAGVPIAVCCVRNTDKVSKNALRRVTRAEFEVIELIGAERVKAESTQALAEYSRGLIAAALGQEE